MLDALEAGDTDRMLDAIDPDERSVDPLGQAFLFLFQGFLSGPAGKIRFKDMRFSVERREGDWAAVRATGRVRAALTEDVFDEVITTRKVQGRWYVTDEEGAPWAVAATATAQVKATAAAIARATAERRSLMVQQETYGITSERIRIGASIALTGAAGWYADPIAGALRAYLQYVNEEAGGVYGRKVELLIYDNGSTPSFLLDIVRTMAEQDQVFAIVDAIGIEADEPVSQYIEENHVPLIKIPALPDTETLLQYLQQNRAWQRPAYLKAAADINDTAVQRHLAIMDEYLPRGRASDATIFGQAVGETIVEVLQRAGSSPTRTKAMEAIRSIDGFVCSVCVTPPTFD